MKIVLGGLALGLVGLTGAAVAQEAGIPAPQAGMTAEGKPVWARLVIRGDAGYHDIGDPAGPLREARPLGTPTTWFPRTNPLMAAFLADPAKPLSFYAKLKTTSSGKIASCTFLREVQAPLAPDEICAAIKQAITFRPALDREGQPVEGEGGLWFSRTEDRWSKADDVPSVIETQIYAPPAPPAPPPPPKLTKFPPYQSWVRYWTGPAAWKVVPTLLAPDGQPLAGIVVGAQGSAMPGCTLMQPSGDAALDMAACPFAEKKLKPKWPSSVEPAQQMAALVVGGSGKNLTAWIAEPRAAHGPLPDPDTRLELNRRLLAIAASPGGSGETELSLLLRIDRSGQVVDCKVHESSGSDRADVEACRRVTQGRWFLPATDVFGRPLDDGITNWHPYPEKSSTGS